MFDTEVRERREHTPWAKIDFHDLVDGFIRDVPWELEEKRAGSVKFTATHRPDVSSRMWYMLEWIDCRGQRRVVWSQYFDLLLWRAAEMQMKARAKLEREEKERDEHERQN